MFYSQQTAISCSIQESTGKQTKSHRQRQESKSYKIHPGGSIDDILGRIELETSEGKRKLDMVWASLQFFHTEEENSWQSFFLHSQS